VKCRVAQGIRPEKSDRQRERFRVSGCSAVAGINPKANAKNKISNIDVFEKHPNAVMPAKAGIQKDLKPLDYRPRLNTIPGQARGNGVK
jgi:hypothetical protein